MSGQPFGFLQIIQVPHHSQFHRATQRFNQVTGKARTAAPQFVDNAHRGIKPAGQTLPFQSVIQKTVAVIERGIDGMRGLAFFPFKQVG